MGSLDSFHLQLTFIAERAWLRRCGRFGHGDSQRSGHPAPLFAEQEPAVIGLLTGMTGAARHRSSRQPHPAVMPIRWSPAGLAIGDRACGKGQSLQRKLLYFVAALGSGLNVELAAERGRVSDQLGGPAGQWLLRCRC